MTVASESVCRMSVVFPVPLGPNRKNDFFFSRSGNIKTRSNIIFPAYISIFDENPHYSCGLRGIIRGGSLEVKVFFSFQNQQRDSPKRARYMACLRLIYIRQTKGGGLILIEENIGRGAGLAKKVHCGLLRKTWEGILLQTPQANIARAMRHITGVYIQRYNQKHGQDAQLFRDRYDFRSRKHLVPIHGHDIPNNPFPEPLSGRE